MDAGTGAVPTAYVGLYVYGVCRRRRCVDPAGDNPYGFCNEHYQKHRARESRRSAEKRALHRELGLCVKCNGLAESGCTMCRRHLDQLRKYAAGGAEPPPLRPVPPPPPPPVDVPVFLGKLVDTFSRTVTMAENQREDFGQELWSKLLAAKVLAKCYDLPEEKRRTFLQVAAWRLALNCKRTLRRKVEPELPFDPQDPLLDEPPEGDEERRAHCRHLLLKMEEKFEGYVLDVYACEGSPRKACPPNDKLFKLLRADF